MPTVPNRLCRLCSGWPGRVGSDWVGSVNTINGVYFEAPVGSGSIPMDRVGADPASDGSGRIESRFNGSPCNVHI